MIMTRYLKKKGTNQVFIRTEHLAESRPNLIEISEKEARRILSGEPEKEVKQELNTETKIALMAEAIGMLDAIEDFTKGGIANDGKPNILALEAMSGINEITAAMRDAAFDQYKAAQEG